MAYNKTFWIDGETKLNAENLNHIEEGIESVSNKANSNFEQINKNTNDIQKNAIDIHSNTNNITFNNDRLNILEAQINADKNTIEYTSDKPLEITCNGANIIDCNAHFKKVEGQTRRYSPNLAKDIRYTYDGTQYYNVAYFDGSDLIVGETYTLAFKTKNTGAYLYVNENALNRDVFHCDGNSYIFSSKLLSKSTDMALFKNQANNTDKLAEDFVYDVQILKGTYTAETIPPFQPYDNTLVNSKATFVSSGRNLLDTNKVTVYNGSIVNGIITIFKSANTNVSLKNNILPAGKYLFQKYYIGSKPSKFYGRIYIQGVENHFDNDTYQVDIKQPSTISFFFSNQNGTVDAVFRLAIYRTDLTTKEYEPYIKNISQYDIELGAYDYIENGNLIKQTSEMITLNGSEGGWFAEGSGNYYKLYFEKQISTTGKAVCNMLELADWGVVNSTEGAGKFFISNDSILINCGIQNDVAKFKQWLKANPITLVYQKATPTITPIVVPNGIVSYKNGLTSQEIKGKYLPYKYTAKYVNGGAK